MSAVPEPSNQPARPADARQPGKISWIHTPGGLFAGDPDEMEDRLAAISVQYHEDTHRTVDVLDLDDREGDPDDYLFPECSVCGGEGAHLAGCELIPLSATMIVEPDPWDRYEATHPDGPIQFADEADARVYHDRLPCTADLDMFCYDEGPDAPAAMDDSPTVSPPEPMAGTTEMDLNHQHAIARLRAKIDKKRRSLWLRPLYDQR